MSLDSLPAVPSDPSSPDGPGLVHQTIQADQRTYSVRIMPGGKIVRVHLSAAEALGFIESYNHPPADRRAEAVAEDSLVVLGRVVPSDELRAARDAAANDAKPGEPPAPEEAAKHAHAERLTAVADFLRVEFWPNVFLRDDPDAVGHLFCGAVDTGNEDDVTVTLDDRKPQPLAAQVAAELRRIGRLYFDMAERYTAACRARGVQLVADPLDIILDQDLNLDA